MNLKENIQRIKEMMEIKDKDLSSSIEKVVRYFISEMDLFDDVEVIKTGENFYSIILFVNKKMAIKLQSGYGPLRNRLISEIGQYLRLTLPEPKPAFNYWDIDKKDRDRIQVR